MKMSIKEFLEIYKDWRQIRAGKKIINQRKGAGYYQTIKGMKQEWEMKSGKIALVELIDYRKFSDPPDMVEESLWHQKGYKGEKLFKDMSFKEYIKLLK